MATDEKCKAAMLPAVSGCEPLRLVILDTDDGWDTFIFNLAEGEWQKQIFHPGEPLYAPTVPTEEEAKRLSIFNGMRFRAETLDAEEMEQRITQYLAELEWNLFDRSLLPSLM
jgi:hypothetical protein